MIRHPGCDARGEISRTELRRRADLYRATIEALVKRGTHPPHDFEGWADPVFRDQLLRRFVALKQERDRALIALQLFEAAPRTCDCDAGCQAQPGRRCFLSGFVVPEAPAA